MLVQLVLLVYFLRYLSTVNPIFYVIFQLISVIMVIWLISKDDNPAYKITWIILVLGIPLFGGIFYLVWGNTPLNRATLIKLKNLDRNLFDIKKKTVPANILSEISDQYPKISTYVETIGNFPLYSNSNCEFFKLGEDFYKSLLINLEKATEYIFLEYFIIENGKMWGSILNILTKKVEQGVEVRVMYDDAGCLSTLPASYHKTLNALGIKCVRFNPFRPTLHTYLNHRDHRKICVIDGKVGYMGGINLADEYINERVRFGHWKDTAILIEGNSVTSLSMMFLELWEFASKEKTKDYSKYIAKDNYEGEGYIQPFSDSPLDSYNVSENVYMKIINKAKKYVYITTPYLILDNEMITALCIASSSGVDVRIVTPHIPDKFYVHAVTRSYYSRLLKSGVRIYEYTPGFIHSKVIISDDDIGVVGTINMDFRSFYMHFECGVLLYKCPVLEDIYKDVEDTLKVSQEISTIKMDNLSVFTRIIHLILRIFSPMM